MNLDSTNISPPKEDLLVFSWHIAADSGLEQLLEEISTHLTVLRTN